MTILIGLALKMGCLGELLFYGLAPGNKRNPLLISCADHNCFY
jgi:hypothetical protein